MITSCRTDQAKHEGYFADGLSSWLRGENGPKAIAASRILAHTILQWRESMGPN